MTEIPSSILFQIPLQIEAERTPDVKAFVLAAFASFEKRIAQLEAKPLKLTPQNSSLPPSLMVNGCSDKKHIVEIESSDRMTNPQLIAKMREHFQLSRKEK